MSLDYITDNRYFNPNIGLQIDKPSNWIFIPANWGHAAKEQQFHDDKKMAELLSKANKPIIFMTLQHTDKDFIYPTVQVLNYLNITTGKIDYHMLLNNYLKHMKNVFQDLKIFEKNSSFILSGCRSIYFKGRYSLVRLEDSHLYKCLTRMIVTVTGNFIFVFTFTAPQFGKFKCEKDVEEIIDSIKIS
jgi:hypothetical protein